jgi:hypothetical protein
MTATCFGAGTVAFPAVPEDVEQRQELVSSLQVASLQNSHSSAVTGKGWQLVCGTTTRV